MFRYLTRLRRARCCSHWLRALDHPRSRREWRDYILLQLACLREQVMAGDRDHALARIVRLAEKIKR